jgi:hypothetical protein
MAENQNDKNIRDRGENFLDFTIGYIVNEKPKNEPEGISNILVEKLKSGTRVLVKKVKDNDKDLTTEFERKKARKFEFKRYR